MRLNYFLELEIQIDGDYTPEDPGVSSLNVLPENCYPGSAAEFEGKEYNILIKDKDCKVIKSIPCPQDIIDLLDDDIIMELANDKYMEECNE